MKKTHFIIVFLIVLNSCKNDDQTPTQQGTQTHNQASSEELIEKYSVEELNEIYAKMIQNANNPTEKGMDTLGLDQDGISFDAVRKALCVIYGHDDRRESLQAKNQQMMDNCKGVLAVIENSKIKKINPNSYELITRSFVDAFNLCSDEPFKEQPVLSFCTAFAVSKNIIITAGHCIKSENDLKNVKFLFDYEVIDNQYGIQKTVPNRLVLTGKRIISRNLDESHLDFAIIETNEEIPVDRILKLELNSTLKENTKVYVIGHPCGLPKKIADSSFVRDNTKANYFVANLDVYGGNSGSPVFNEITHKIEGILVRGEQDFDKKGSCYLSKPCPDLKCNGEEVSRNSQFLSAVVQYLNK